MSLNLWSVSYLLHLTSTSSRPLNSASDFERKTHSYIVRLWSSHLQLLWYQKLGRKRGRKREAAADHVFMAVLQ